MWERVNTKHERKIDRQTDRQTYIIEADLKCHLSLQLGDNKSITIVKTCLIGRKIKDYNSVNLSKL